MVSLWTTPLPFTVSSERCNSTFSSLINGIIQLREGYLENALKEYAWLSCGTYGFARLQFMLSFVALSLLFFFLLFYFRVFNRAFSLIIVQYPLSVRKEFKWTCEKSKGLENKRPVNCSQLWHNPSRDYRRFTSLSLKLIFPVCKI